VLLGVLAFRWPPAHYNRASEWGETANRLGRQIYQTIRDQPNSRNARVFFTAPGPVDDMLLRFHAGQDNLQFRCPNQHLSSDPAVFRQEIDLADFVVASEPGSAVVYDQMMVPNLQANALQLAQQHPQLTEIARLPALNGKFFHIFVRRDLAARASEPKIVPFENPWKPLYGDR
jgi:hypothetical protein